MAASGQADGRNRPQNWPQVTLHPAGEFCTLTIVRTQDYWLSVLTWPAGGVSFVEGKKRRSVVKNLFRDIHAITR